MSKLNHSGRWRCAALMSMAKTSLSQSIACFTIIISVFIVARFIWPFVIIPNVTVNLNVDFQAKSESDSYWDELSYMVGNPVKDWDIRRKEWLQHHEKMLGVKGQGSVSMSEKVVVVTGSQSQPCHNPIGDHLLLRSFKNKVDYCRIHGYDIFYNNVLLHPKMSECWAKLPAIRIAMLSHPEAEWILWVDADAVFTDMEFEFPFDRYKDYNFVVEGWNTYEKRSFTSINAGVFLIKNCQWSMDFMEAWASMSPQSPEYLKWGKIQQSVIKDKSHSESDDQSALLYLMLEAKAKAKWGDKIFLEQQLSFQSHWVGVIDQLRNFTKAQLEDDRMTGGPKRIPEATRALGFGLKRSRAKGLDRMPIMIHFAGCQPCTGSHNPSYEGKSCWEGMNQALTFADNQVLMNYGLVHLNLSDSAVSRMLKQ